MKTSYGIILVLAMAAAMLLSVSRPCRAVEKDKDDKHVWSEDKPEQWHGWFELTDEAVERTMNRLKETNPEKAKELAKLREKDPEKFKAKLRKVMRERFGKRFREQREGFRKHTKPKASRKYHPEKDMQMMGRGEPGGRQRERTRDRMREKHAEYLEWLKKNYPEKAEKLAELRKIRPELYMKKLGLSCKKYWRIAEAAEENPELAEALKEDLELKEKRGKLLRKIKAAVDDDEKKELVEELEDVVSSRFDLIVKRKQIRYEQMSKKLEKLKKKVEKSKADVEKWKEVKGGKVKERLGELIGQAEKFKWDW